MQRGILQLSKAEQIVVVKLLEGTTLQTSLIGKRLSAKNGDNSDLGEDTLELSRDEAESLLDLLPIPSHAEPSEVTNVRQKLNTFLQNL